MPVKQRAVIFIDSTGVKVSVEEGRTLQACIWLEKSTWSSYKWIGRADTDDDGSDESDDMSADDESKVPNAKVRSVTFEVSLAALLECLNVFTDPGASYSFKGGRGGGSGAGADDGDGMTTRGLKTSAEFSYSGEGEPFVVILEASGIVTRCELTTYNVDERLALEFDADETQGHLIMKSEWFKELFQELGSGSTSMTFTFSPPGYGASANLSLEAEGMFGTTRFDYPNDSDVLETCDIRQKTSNTYSYAMINLTKPAVSVSSKMAIRVDQTGLLDMQMLVPTTRDKSVEKAGFIEFQILPKADEIEET